MVMARIITGVGTGHLNAIVPVWSAETSGHLSRGFFIALEFTLNIFGVVGLWLFIRLLTRVLVADEVDSPPPQVVAYWLGSFLPRLLPKETALSERVIQSMDCPSSATGTPRSAGGSQSRSSSCKFRLPDRRSRSDILMYAGSIDLFSASQSAPSSCPVRISPFSGADFLADSPDNCRIASMAPQGRVSRRGAACPHSLALRRRSDQRGSPGRI